MSGYRISLVVPIYGVEKYIRQFAESALGQTYQDLQFVFVNDGSKDRTYPELKKLGYKQTDLVGKDGIEKAYESHLRGIDGSKTTETTVTGKTTTVLYEEPPVLGKNCVLTIDLKMQEAAEAALAETVPRLRREGATNSRWGGADAKGAAVVAIDVKTGGLLVSASYPTYDISQYSKNYNAMKNDKNLPMFNRAIQGAYPPGSTFKMITAVAGLEENIIEPKEKMLTTGKYMYYAPSTTPMCDIFRQYGKTHGEIDVAEAIKVSCNYFFYDIGDRLTMDQIDAVAKGFGLGEKTGIELDEAVGMRANAENKAKLYTGAMASWGVGDKMNAAIGQSENRFTPLQMCVYVATVANKGVRMKATFLNRVVASDYRTLILENEPTVASTLKMSNATYSTIVQGMKQVITGPSGTARNTMTNMSVEVAAKTGTAETGRLGSDDGSFVCFAPVDNPEIAIAVFGEKAAHGSTLGRVARAVIEYYFYQAQASAVNTYENQIA